MNPTKSRSYPVPRPHPILSPLDQELAVSTTATNGSSRAFERDPNPFSHKTSRRTVSTMIDEPPLIPKHQPLTTRQIQRSFKKPSHPVLSQVGTIRKSHLEEHAKKIIHPHVPFETSATGRTRVTRSLAAPVLSSHRVKMGHHERSRSGSNKENERADSLRAEFEFDPVNSDVLLNYSSGESVKATQGQTEESNIVPATSSESQGSSSTTLSGSRLPPREKPAKITGSEYQYRPPAAAKYYLWDTTSLGPPTLWKSSDVFANQVTVSRHVLQSIEAFMLKRRSPGTKQVKIGFCIGRYVPAASLDPSTTRKSIVIDRFDQGRAINNLLCPTLLAPEDVVLPVLHDLEENVSVLYYNVLSELQNQRVFDTIGSIHGFLLVTGLPSSMSIQVCQIKTDYSFKGYQIRPIRAVASSLYMELTDPTNSESVPWGFVTIDQSRHAYFLTNTDLCARELPVLGLWFCGEDTQSQQVRLRILAYLGDSRLTKMDTGKQNLLLCFFGNHGTGKLKSPEYWQCDFSLESQVPLFSNSHSFSIGKETASKDGPVVLPMERFQVEENDAICKVVEDVFGLKLRPVVDLESTPVEEEKSEEVKEIGEETVPSKSDSGATTNTQVESASEVSSSQPQTHASEIQVPLVSTSNAIYPPYAQAMSHIQMGMYPGPDPTMGYGYMMMLQKQVEMLQTQLFAMSMKASPPVESPVTTPVTSTVQKKNPVLTISEIHSLSIPPVDMKQTCIDAWTNTEELVPVQETRKDVDSIAEPVEEKRSITPPINEETSAYTQNDAADGRMIIPDLVDNADQSFVFDTKEVSKLDVWNVLPRKSNKKFAHSTRVDSAVKPEMISSRPVSDAQDKPNKPSQSTSTRLLRPERQLIATSEGPSTLSLYENYSVASLEYLEKYGLLSGPNQQTEDDYGHDVTQDSVDFSVSDIQPDISTLKPPLPPNQSERANLPTYRSL